MSPLLDEVLTWVRSQTRSAADDLLPDDARLPHAAMVRRVLTSPDGEAFLTWLARLTVLRPATDPGLTGPASHDFAQRRTGENAIFAAAIFYHDLAVAHERTPSDARPEHAASPAFPFSVAAAAGAPGDERFTDPGFDPAGLVGGR